jgi:4-hydroxy-3-polyprenylbenzoate decarboxylase
MGRTTDLAYSDLRQWIAALDKAGELKHINAEVDPILEISEIADRVSKLGPPNHAAGGPALLFENIKGYPGAKLLMNQFGSERRMRLALGVDSLDDVSARIRELMNLRSPEGFLDKVRMLPMLAEMGKFFPKVVAAKDAPCKEVILRENFSVLDFPILQCWPQDGGRFITLPCVITRDPRKVDAAGNPAGKRNVGMYRMQVYDGQTTGMHWQRQKVAAEHFRDRLRQSAEAGSADAAAARVARMAETAGGAMLAPSIIKNLSSRPEVAAATAVEGPAFCRSRFTPHHPQRVPASVPEDDVHDEPPSACPTPDAYKSASSQCPRVPATSAPCAGPPRVPPCA